MVTGFYSLTYLLLMSRKKEVKHTLTQISDIWIKLFILWKFLWNPTYLTSFVTNTPLKVDYNS